MSDKKVKSNAKNSQLIIRINDELKDSFISLCDDLDTSAAREIRHFIKRYIAEHQSDAESIDQ
jgi:antitoxin component of RelBE/YafQ-DinJ toxin-antitoxin module